MEFESWKKNFIMQLYDSTKEAVEVSKRNYLESRLAKGILREMTEVHEKYHSLFYQNESKFGEIWAKFEELEEQTNAAIGKLKENSDAFCKASSHGIPYKVETLKFDEIEKIRLPDYSIFLFDPNFVSFGPISEKWEDVKNCLQQEFTSFYLENSPVLTLGRSCSTSLSSNMNISALEDESEGLDDQELETNSSNHSVPDSSSVTASPLACRSGKPAIASRRKKNSFKRTMSETLQQIVFSAAHSAENKRIISRTVQSSKLPI